ncbi:hypothetical protein EYC95_19800 [Pseudomonas sp. BGI-2]|nr:hypothetical protein EYC95_19800 [Pseudomonas sp. BGI-2]
MSQTSGLHDGISGDHADLFAGKPRSYRISSVHNFGVHLKNPVGARLAREGVRTGATQSQSNMNSGSLLNCASNRLAGIGRPNRYP